MKLRSLLACAAITGLAMAAPAHAEIFDKRLQVKVGVMGVLPNEGDDAGLNIDISDEVLPTLQLEWFFTDNISAELLCCLAPHDISAPAIGAIGDTTLFPPTVTLKYRFNPGGSFQPYIGAGVNYTTFFSEDANPAVAEELSLDDSFGAALQVGADFPINDRWAINVDVRRVWISTDATLSSTGAPDLVVGVDIDPWVVSTSVGYRF